MAIENTKEDTITLYIVSVGKYSAGVTSLEASKSLCKALEDSDPYGGIPFVKKLSMGHTEALETMQRLGSELIVNLVEGIKQ